MTKATLVIATAFALATMAMAAEVALRRASIDDVVRATDALNAAAAAAADEPVAAPRARPVSRQMVNATP